MFIVRPASREYDLNRDPGGEPLRAMAGHGTQTLDIAAGDDPLAPQDFSSAAHQILAVQLPPEIIARTNGFLSELYIKSAMNWIWLQHAWHARDAELVVNVSLTTNCGRHDGLDILEADFQRRLEFGEVDFISVPAGNAYLSRTHAEYSYDDLAQMCDLELFVQPDSKEPVFVQMYPEVLDLGSTTSPLEVHVFAPTGESITAASIPPGYYETMSGDIAKLYHQADKPLHLLPRKSYGKDRFAITIAINPTDTLFYKSVPPAPPGRWKVRLKRKGNLVPKSVVHVRVERGDSVAGFPPRGRQAYFSDFTYQLWDAAGFPEENDVAGTPIRREGTINGFGTAIDVTTVASHRTSDKAASRFSSARSGKMHPPQPSITLPSEASHARPNVLAAGILSGSVAHGSGTSYSCARAARSAAILALSGGTKSHKTLKERLEDLAKPPNRRPNPVRTGKGLLLTSLETGRRIPPRHPNALPDPNHKTKAGCKL